jgi:hypothetical protein
MLRPYLATNSPFLAPLLTETPTEAFFAKNSG